jgi:hypothetical protein
MSTSQKSLRGKDADLDQPPEYRQNEQDRLLALSRLALQPIPPPNPDFDSMAPAAQSQYNQILKLRSTHEEVGTAHRTNQLLSQHMALISKPAMLPHYLSLEVTSKDGNISSKAVMNPHRTQCVVCKEYFFNMEARLQHKKDLPQDCDDCGKCFRSITQHAEHFSHTRCFWPHCLSEFRYSYGNAPMEVRNHIMAKHRS